MKILSLLCLLSLVTACSQKNPNKSAQAPSAPQMEIELAPSTIDFEIEDSVLMANLADDSESIDLGQVYAGAKATKRIILSAKTLINPLDISGFRNAELFNFKFSNCATSLMAKRICVVDMEFTASAIGEVQENIAFGSNVNFLMKANVVAAPVVVDTSLDKILVTNSVDLGIFSGIKKTSRFLITNLNNYPVEVQVAQNSGSAGFSFVSYCPTSPNKLRSKGACQVEISYDSLDLESQDVAKSYSLKVSNSKIVAASVVHQATVQSENGNFTWLSSPLNVGNISVMKKFITYVENKSGREISSLSFSSLPEGVTISRTNCNNSLRHNYRCYIELQFAPRSMTDGNFSFQYNYSSVKNIAKLTVLGTVIGGLPPVTPCSVSDAQSNGVIITNSNSSISGNKIGSDASACLLSSNACNVNYALSEDSKQCILSLPYAVIPSSFSIANGFAQTIASSMNNMSVMLNCFIYIVATDGLYKLSSLGDSLEKIATAYQPQGNGNHHTPVVFNNKIYFPASDSSSADFANEIWESDGTAAGTQKVTSTIGHRPTGLTATSSHIFYRTGSANGFNIYKLDMNNVSSVAISSNTTPMLTTINGNFLYTDFTDLFLYNGSFGSMIKKINPSGSFWGPDVSNVLDYVKINEKLYFSGKNAAGSEPWVSDGTSAGTVSLGDVTPGASGSNPKGFLEINGKVFFMTQTSPVKVYLYNPADSSMALIKTFPSTYSAAGSKQIQNIVRVKQGLIVFALENNGVYEIWKTDGTESGTIPATGVFADLAKNLNNSGYFRMIELVFQYEGSTYLQVNFADSRGKQLIKLLE